MIATQTPTEPTTCPITSRVFTSFPGSRYVLPADEQEKQRLYRQHFMLVRSFNNQMLLAPISLKSGDKVLESGTGTGIWLLELAKQVPKGVEMHGIDIESRQFPLASERPPNVNYSINTITNLPSEWSTSFSLVHQRLLLAALQKTGWPVALSEMYRVTVPGGWVQLLEAGEWISGPVNTRHRSLITALEKSRGLMWDVYKHLPSMLSEAGFENVHVEPREMPMGKWAGEEGTEQRDNLIDLWKAMKGPILAAGGFGIVNSEKELDDLLDDLEKEWDERVGTSITWVTIYAQKPY